MSETRKQVKVYTDGSCSGNPGPGGWGAVLLYMGHRLELSGGEESTTNNRMELTAAVKALSALKEPCDVTLYTDSRYIEQAFSQGWVKNWVKKGWKKSDGKPVLNRDLWERLIPLMELHRARLVWVKGHADNEYNNRCDFLATQETKKFQKVL